MPIQIRIMSWNIQKKQGNAAYIAALMQSRAIDIIALLEVPNSAVPAIPNAIIAALNNLNPAYELNNWQFRSVNVGDESVTYIWHQTNVVGPNAFRAETYANVPAVTVAGKVMKNQANATIYFPKTGTSWSSLPGKPAGRRPAYMSFVTNDGQPARRFTVLDIHAPFNKAQSIQSYSAFVYASSREAHSVETISISDGAAANSATLAATLAASVDPVLANISNPNSYTNPGGLSLRLRTAAVTAALQAIQEAAGGVWASPSYCHGMAVDSGTYGAMAAVGAIPLPISVQDATHLARACAMAGALAATSMIASAQLPTAPVAPVNATGSVPNALAAAGAIVTGVVGQYVPSTINSNSWTSLMIGTEAVRMARTVRDTFVFPALPLQAVNASVVAGDFNVDHPDTILYTTTQLNKLPSGNAYAALVAGIGAARIAERTTRIGPTAYKAQRLYRLRNPCPIQHANATIASYVPLDVSTLVATVTNFVGNDAWVAGLKALPQGASWAKITSPPYSDRIYAAFDSNTSINDSRYYRANCYDNIFVRGATVTQAAVVDVISELGSWNAQTVANPRPGLAPNPTAAAAGTLNALAQAALLHANRHFTYDNGNVDFDISGTLATAEDAAVFFDQFISDHLPVYVRVQI